MSELEACRSEGRNYSSEVYRLKSSYDETMEQLDVVRRENKNLADEIKCVYIMNHDDHHFFLQ